MELSPPVVTADTVYVGSDGGDVYAVDRKSGKQRWQTRPNAQSWGLYSSPAVADGTVYLSNGWSLHAFEADSGDELDGEWPIRERSFSRDVAHAFSAPTVVDGTVYITDKPGYVYAFDADSGKPVWDQPFDTGNRMRYWRPPPAPAVVDDVVVGNLGVGVFGLDAATGDRLWRYVTNNEIAAAPAVAGETVYAPAEVTASSTRWKRPARTAHGTTAESGRRNSPRRPTRARWTPPPP